MDASTDRPGRKTEQEYQALIKPGDAIDTPDGELRVVTEVRRSRRGPEGTLQAMDVFEPIRRGYHALGFGADADVLAMLDQGGPQPARWEIHSLDPRGVRSRPTGEVAALDLFGAFPAQYDLAGVRVRSWSPNERRARLVVGGTYRLRVRGTSEAFDLPFTHIWSFADGRVKDVLNLTEGFELRRLPAADPRAA
jgi:hypothetical protein